MRYRRKPDEVDAFLITETNINNRNLWPDWLKEAADKETNQINAFCVRKCRGELACFINTELGISIVTCGGFVVKTEDGVLLSYKRDVFLSTYEEV